MSKIIGIDLGSTLSEVAVMEGNNPVIITNDEGSRTTPSVVYINDGERKVGAPAKRQAITNPKKTVTLIKRFMGGTYDEIKDNITHVQYDVKNVGGYPRVLINDKEYSPEEISAMILQKMKKTAEDYLGTEVKDAVITVPAFFNDAQRQATIKAGEIAGLNVKRIIAEPTAAILASGIDMKKDAKYMVVDYGGSTTDVSIADISDGVVEILSSYGDVYCGGSDIDKLLAEEFVKEFKNSTNMDLSKDPMAMSRIMEAAEKAKMELTSSTTTDVNLPYISAKDGVPQHLNTTITRAKFEKIIDSEVTKVLNCAKEAINKANIKASDIAGIVLVGGSTRIPYVQSQLEKTFSLTLIKSAPVDEAVALGAAVQGSIINGDKNDVILLDVTPLTLGIATMNDVMATLVEANTTIPCKRSQIFTTAEDNQTAVTIQVCQGNRPLASQNKQIGMFNLEGIAPARRGVPQIEVTFDIDVNGVLHVSAVDKATGKTQEIRIEAQSGLSQEEIERMKAEAEANAEADKKKKEDIDTVNGADSFVFSVTKSMEDFGDKITEDEKKEVNDAIEPLKKAIEEKNIEDIKKYQSELQTKWYSIAGKIYQQTNPQGTANEAQGNGQFGDIFSGFTGDAQTAQEV
jgi:molecular chaperone DnaK